METNKYLDKIEKLVDFYGFPAKASSVALNNEFSFAFHISLCLAEIMDTTTPLHEQLEECMEFVRFLTSCRGSEITMIGKITTDDFIGTEKKINLKNWHLLQVLQAIAMIEGEKIERYVCKHGIIKEEPLKKNKLLGKYASQLLWVIDSFEFGAVTQTKKCSFIYDALQTTGLIDEITGRESITEEGFSGLVGVEKFQEVRKWLNAYKKVAKNDIYCRITPHNNE